jgi:membrane-associated phospholipid phosphatase
MCGWLVIDRHGIFSVHLRKSFQMGTINMEKLKRIFFLNRSFFIGALLLIVIGFFYLLFTTRAESFLYLNAFHGKSLDRFFLYFTNLGDGVFAIIIAVIYLIFRRYQIFLQVLISFLFSGLVTQLMKRFIFSPRPKDYFNLKENIYIIKDVTLGGNASFPSGHTATAFALATSLALYGKNKNAGWIYFLFALLIGYSRIYLAHHFPRDVFAGAIIGMLAALFVYQVLQHYRPNKMLKDATDSNKKDRGNDPGLINRLFSKPAHDQ